MLLRARHHTAFLGGSLALLFFPYSAHAQSAMAAAHLSTLARDSSSSCVSQPQSLAVARRYPSGETPCELRPQQVASADSCRNADATTGACQKESNRIAEALFALGKRGETIVKAREQVLEILESNNSCSAWFQEADPDPAGTFRSLGFVLDEKGPRNIRAVRAVGEPEVYRHPYAASSVEDAGRNSAIRLNANGPFFNRFAQVLEQRRVSGPVEIGGMRELQVGPYPGNTAFSQITVLLHELGHITGRLREDNDTWDESSNRNTAEVLRFCRAEINAAARKKL